MAEPLAYTMGEESKDKSLACFILDQEQHLPIQLREVEHSLKRERAMRLKAERHAVETRDKLLSEQARQMQLSARAAASEVDLAACRAQCERERAQRERAAAAAANAEERLATALASLAAAQQTSSRHQEQARELQAALASSREAQLAGGGAVARLEREAEALRAEKAGLAADIERLRGQVQGQHGEYIIRACIHFLIMMLAAVCVLKHMNSS
jgi:chromosome segregation ATPase